ncbi:hypothetical protein CCR75_001639 [Bremia lactucae]|uniref:Cell division control protein 45 n=1 Tax=Bremia lactucae TaxID=4779 RepID=A0A976IFS2_BRELC|nr:hypothetical protein CCR75_001639 [Bremia lactucae]
MLWPREEFHAAYAQIKHDALQGGGTCSILLLVALDVDALCAAEILTRLLRADMLSYSLLAMRGYEDVLEARETRIRSADGRVRGGMELRSVILLNCGAIVDVAKLLALPRHVKCYVFDSHRPIHLANLYDEHQQIVVFDDEALPLDAYPAFGPDLDVEDWENDSSEDEQDTSEGEAEVPEDTNVEVGDKRGRDNNNEHDVENTKRRRNESADLTTQEGIPALDVKRQRRQAILRYYRGSFHGAPAATIAYEIAQQLNRATREILWFAIVGLTKQLVLEEIDMDNYNLLIARYQDEVLAMQQTTVAHSTNELFPGYDDGKLTFEEEYRFLCYRHWSLYEAMYYSDYVASKLGLYDTQVRRLGASKALETTTLESNLHVFLARMGISLRQSRQQFAYMPLELKQLLRHKMHEMASEFGLDDLFYGSFQRQFAFQYQLCAADAVYGLQALLEAPERYIASVFETETRAREKALVTLFAQDTSMSSSLWETQDPDGNTDSFRQHNFMLAHTALACHSVTSSKLMESGIQVAMALKQAIVRVGLSIMQRKLLVRVKHFRYVCLHVPENEQELFANANVLTQLALFLLNVHRASGKWGGPPTRGRQKVVNEESEDEEDRDEDVHETTTAIVPLVLITRNPQENCFLVIGLTCPSTPGEIHRNTLGTAFKLAAGETGANFRQDGFTSAVMEIQIDEIQNFVEQLHNVLDA